MKEIPLMLLHGYPFDHTMWFSTIAALGRSAKVLAPDLPGFGKALLPEGKKSSFDLVADGLANLLDEHKFERAAVAGMSMGGYAAMAFALRFPARLTGLGLISSQTTADTIETRQARHGTIKKIRAEGTAMAVNTLLPKMFAGEKAKNPNLTSYLNRAAAAAGVEGLCWALQAMADRPDRTALVRQLKVPVLVIHGTEDQIVPCAKARQLAETCRHPIYVELKGVGHASPLEAPDQVAAGLARFMAAVRESQGSADGIAR
jgi:3-oxoadipate enol-lactonase